MIKLYGAYYNQLNEMAMRRAMENIVDPLLHMEAVEIERFTFMEGAKAAFDLIAEVLHCTEDPNELDMNMFDDDCVHDAEPDDFAGGDKKKLLN